MTFAIILNITMNNYGHFVESTMDAVTADNEFDKELEKVLKINLVLAQINKLYDNVIEKFQRGELIVYNPNLFCNLSKEKFIKWIIINNSEIRNLYR